jgi:hypothetical protein
MTSNVVPWKDSAQIGLQLNSYDEAQRKKILDLYSLHYFLTGALPKKNTPLLSPFDKAIAISDYGRTLLSQMDVSTHRNADIALATVLTFFHRDFLIDVDGCDVTAAMQMLTNELKAGSLRFPQRFGRTLYDKYNDSAGLGRQDHLAPDQVDSLLDGTEQGVYQIGRFVVGPLGVFESQEIRLIPPSPRVPLWHCADPGCQTLHSVKLLKHQNDAYFIASELDQAAKELEGPESVWEGPIRWLQQKTGTTRAREYYDLLALIADAVSDAEKQQLVTEALSGKSGNVLRECIRSAKGKSFEKAPSDSLADKLSGSSKVQLLMVLTDGELVELIDKTVFRGQIKIPATETRRSRLIPPKLSSYDLPSTLSILGVRPERERPILFLTSTIWREYKKAGQLTELAWRCQLGGAMPRPEEVMAYMRSHTAPDAVRNLILPSRPIALAIAKKLCMEIFPSEPEDHLIDRFLWKFGFKLAQYDMKYERLRSHLQKFREELVASPTKLTDDHRDAIRSRGVNVFVSLENFIEELVSYNIWLLFSDHFGVTNFEYKFSDATAQVAAILGSSRTVSGETFAWRVAGGNALGTLLIYGRLAADWMLALHEADKSGLQRPAEDFPHFVDDRTRRFPFQHRQLWADAVTAELQKFAEQFASLIEQLERARLAEVRNGIDHYREAHRFPGVDVMIACENRISSVLDSADINRFIPKAYWLVETKKDEFGITEDTLQDYKARKLVIRGPSILGGLKEATFSTPLILPYGNLLGYTNSDLLLHLIEQSSYTSMWDNYPRRSKDIAEEGHAVEGAAS